jgi:hypothetical protein
VKLATDPTLSRQEQVAPVFDDRWSRDRFQGEVARKVDLVLTHSQMSPKKV